MLNSIRGYVPDRSRLMENAIYNELRYRGYDVDVGMVPQRKTVSGRQTYCQLEIDFIANRGNERKYVQSAFSVPDAEKHAQEVRPFLKSGGSFRKFLVVDGDIGPWTDEDGIVMVGATRFLLDESILR